MFKEVHVDDIESRAGAPQIAALLAYYRTLCGDGALPSYADFNPERLTEHASNLAVVEPIGIGDYLYIYYGRTIFETSGVEMLGSKVSQWKSEVGAFFCQAYHRTSRPSRHPSAFVGAPRAAGPRTGRLLTPRRVQQTSRIPG